MRNTIVRYNRNTAGEANVYRGSTATFDRVCTTDEAGETGVIAAAPVFADAEGGDWRLTYCSCVDAGADMPWMAGATDLDGAARIAGDRVQFQADILAVARAEAGEDEDGNVIDAPADAAADDDAAEQEDAE